MEKVIVTIVDRQALFRIGVRHALSVNSDIEVLEAAPNENLIELIEANSPNILLLDIDYPSLKGLDIARKISLNCPTTKIIILTINPDDRQLFEIIKAGANAFLEKGVSAEELTATVRQVAKGEYLINESVMERPSVATHVLRQFQSIHTNNRRTMDGVVTSLTSRETQILNYIADGNSNKQIAYILEISEQTAKNHVSNILRKLNANDRAHAVVLAIRNGWILAEGVKSPDIASHRN